MDFGLGSTIKKVLTLNECKLPYTAPNTTINNEIHIGDSWSDVE